MMQEEHHALFSVGSTVLMALKALSSHFTIRPMTDLERLTNIHAAPFPGLYIISFSVLVTYMFFCHSSGKAPGRWQQVRFHPPVFMHIFHFHIEKNLE